jgi:hypothetical protein
MWVYRNRSQKALARAGFRHRLVFRHPLAKSFREPQCDSGGRSGGRSANLSEKEALSGLLLPYRADREGVLRVDLTHPPNRRGMAAICVRREKAALSNGCKSHPANAPAGSNRSSHGGDEMAEAFGATGHV